jgi:hypothetical protein
MSLIGLNSTITATRTLTAPMEVASPSDITLPSALTVRNNTTTTPVTTTSGATARIVLGARLNYAKIQTASSANAGTVVLHVIGWNRGDDGQWRPQLLTTCTVTAGAVTTSVNGANQFLGLTYRKDFGDCKVYNGNTAAVYGGFIIVDLCGAELVEIAMTASSTPTANALIGFI